MTTTPARSVTVSSSGWKRVTSLVFSPTSSWAGTAPLVCSSAAKKVDLPALWLGGAAQALAVHGQPPKLGRLRAAVGEPAAHRLVQRVTVDARQQPADCGFRRQRPPGQKRIGADAESVEHVRGGVGDPLTDRQ